MLEIYNKNEILPENKRILEDLFSGDGSSQAFAMTNITPDVLARVFVDKALKGTNTDFFTYLDSGTNWINFYTAPIFGTNNIILQSNTCLYFPNGTNQEGSMNGYLGETLDFEFYINNNEPLKGYTEIDIIPIDEFENSEETLIKLATTQGGLSSATAGATLRISDITDSNTLHGFWARVTIPARYMLADIPAYNKYNLSLAINSYEYDV